MTTEERQSYWVSVTHNTPAGARITYALGDDTEIAWAVSTGMFGEPFIIEPIDDEDLLRRLDEGVDDLVDGHEAILIKDAMHYVRGM